MLPDPNPYEAPETDAEALRHTFRSSLWVSMLGIVLSTNGVYLTEVGLGAGLTAHVGDVVPGIAIASLAAVLLTILVVYVYPVHITEMSVRCYDFWGVYSTVDWRDISKVHPINLLGLRFLRVRSTGTRAVIWIPRFLANQDQFEAYVREYTEAGNPIREFIPQQAE